MAPVLAPFSVGMGPFGRSGGSKFLAFEKPCKSHSGQTKNACCLIHIVSRICFSLKEKCTPQKCIFFEFFGPLIFVTVFSAICGTVVEKNDKNTGGSKLGFWDPLAHSEVEGSRNFGSGICVTKTAGFTTCCLSSVVPLVSVESVVESVMLK